MSKRSMEVRFSEADDQVSLWSCDTSYHISLSGVVDGLELIAKVAAHWDSAPLGSEPERVWPLSTWTHE